MFIPDFAIRSPCRMPARSQYVAGRRLPLEHSTSSIWETVGRFFEQSQNQRFAELLRQLADTAIACATHFRDGGQRPAGHHRIRASR